MKAVSGKDEPERPPLRLVKTPEPKRPAADPRLKAILDDLQRPPRVKRERMRLDPGGKDAA